MNSNYHLGENGSQSYGLNDKWAGSIEWQVGESSHVAESGPGTRGSLVEKRDLKKKNSSSNEA